MRGPFSFTGIINFFSLYLQHVTRTNTRVQGDSKLTWERKREFGRQNPPLSSQYPPHNPHRSLVGAFLSVSGFPL